MNTDFLFKRVSGWISMLAMLSFSVTTLLLYVVSKSDQTVSHLNNKEVSGWQELI